MDFDVNLVRRCFGIDAQFRGSNFCNFTVFGFFDPQEGMTLRFVDPPAASLCIGSDSTTLLIQHVRYIFYFLVAPCPLGLELICKAGG